MWDAQPASSRTTRGRIVSSPLGKSSPLARQRVLDQNQVDAAVRLLDSGIGQVLDGEADRVLLGEAQARADVRAELERRRHAVLVVVDGLAQQVAAEPGLEVAPRLLGA